MQLLEETYSAIILLGPSMDLPVELEKEIVIIDFKPPSCEELRERFVELIADYKGQPGVEITFRTATWMRWRERPRG